MVKTKQKNKKKFEVAANTILEAMVDGVCIIDINGNIAQCNTSYAKMHGFTKPKEMIGKNLTKLIAKKEISKIMNELRKISKTGITVNFEITSKDKKGGEFPVLINAKVLKDEKSKIAGIIVALRDITNFKQIEEELLSERDFSQSIVDSLPGHFYIFNDKGHFIRWNKKLEKDTEYSAKEVAKMDPRDFFIGKDRKIITNAIKETLAKGEGSAEAYFTSRSGKKTPYYYVGLRTKIKDITIIVGMGINITKQKEAEKELRRSERELFIRNRIAHIFLTVPDEEMYTKVLQVVLESLESKCGTFGYIDEDESLVVPSITGDFWKKCQVANKNIVFPRDRWGDSIWCRAIKEKKTLYSNKPSRVPKGHIPISRNVSLPIIHRENVIGLLQVANKNTDYDEKDIQLLESLATHIAPVLYARLRKEKEEKERKQTEKELQKKVRELEEFSEIAIERELDMKKLEEELEKLKGK